MVKMMESDLYRRVASIHCNRNELEAIKSRYESDISSQRRYDSIRTLSDLLKILIKRDCLSLNNIEPLIEIGQCYGNEEIRRLINKYKNNNNENPILLESPPEAVVIQENTDAKWRAYRLIAEEIGRNWKDFARALDIRESRIEELENESKISESTYKILRQYEKNCDKRRFKSGILNGLEKARRCDLKNTVQEIFDIH